MFFLRSQWAMSLGMFITLITLAHLIVFQAPLLEYTLEITDLPNPHSIVQIVSLQGLQILMLAAFLMLVSVFSLPVLKFVCIVIFLANGLALYFMNTYHIEFSREMIGNILNTDTREVSELWSPSVLLYILLFGLLPVGIIAKIRILSFRWYWRIPFTALIVMVLLGWVYLFSPTWPWYDKHLSRMSGRALPWSYLINTPRYFQKIAFSNRTIVLLPDAEFLISDPTRKQIVVLMIGEAARAENFSHYEYARKTNAFTERLDHLFVFPAGDACATNTIGAVACIVTHQGSDASAYSTDEPIQSYLTRHGVETIFLRNNSGMPPINVIQQYNAAERAQSCKIASCPDAKFDGALVAGLQNLLETSVASRIFVTIHLNGSHGPSYSIKYPRDFAYFTPECTRVEVAHCSKEELYNSYDNSLRYTDWVLASTIQQLQKITDSDIALIYVSDHGQSLGENGLYLHGMPLAFAPEQQKRIPFLVWMNTTFQKRLGIVDSNFIPTKSYPHDFPFHSIMGAFDMRSDVYKPQFDIFAVQKP